MVSINFETFAQGIISTFDPAVRAVIEVLPFPINGALALIWGGIKEILLTILFG